MARDKIYFSTYAFPSDKLDGILKMAAELEINRLELSSALNFNTAHMDILLSSDFRFLVHHYFPTPRSSLVVNLASQKDEILEQSIKHCKRAIEFSKKVGSQVYSVHGGYLADPFPSDLGKPFPRDEIADCQKGMETFVRSANELVLYGEDRGVRIAVENNVVAPFNVWDGKKHPFLMVTAEDFIQLNENVLSDNLYYLIDMGHLKVSAKTLSLDKIDFLERLRNKILIFHLSDNDGTEDSNELFTKESWFFEKLREFPDTYIIVECKKMSKQDMLDTKRLLDETRR